MKRYRKYATMISTQWQQQNES